MLEENGSEKAVIKVSGVIEINQEVVQEFILRFRLSRNQQIGNHSYSPLSSNHFVYEGMGIAFDYAFR